MPLSRYQVFCTLYIHTQRRYARPFLYHTLHFGCNLINMIFALQDNIVPKNEVNPKI